MSAVRRLDDLLISQGRYIVTTDDIEGAIGPSPNVSGRLAGLRRQHRLVSAAKGLYLVIPAEYRTHADPGEGRMRTLAPRPRNPAPRPERRPRLWALSADRA